METIINKTKLDREAYDVKKKSASPKIKSPRAPSEILETSRCDRGSWGSRR